MSHVALVTAGTATRETVFKSTAAGQTLMQADHELTRSLALSLTLFHIVLDFLFSLNLSLISCSHLTI